MRIPVGIENHTKGTTFDGLEIFAQEENELNVLEPIDLTDVEAIAQFKISIDGPVIFEFNTTDETILIPEPLSGKLYFASRIIDYPAKTYLFDVKLKFPDGRIKVIVPIHSWTII